MTMQEEVLQDFLEELGLGRGVLNSWHLRCVAAYRVQLSRLDHGWVKGKRFRFDPSRAALLGRTVTPKQLMADTLMQRLQSDLMAGSIDDLQNFPQQAPGEVTELHEDLLRGVYGPANAPLRFGQDGATSAPPPRLTQSNDAADAIAYAFLAGRHDRHDWVELTGTHAAADASSLQKKSPTATTTLAFRRHGGERVGRASAARLRSPVAVRTRRAARRRRRLT